MKVQFSYSNHFKVKVTDLSGDGTIYSEGMLRIASGMILFGIILYCLVLVNDIHII